MADDLENSRPDGPKHQTTKATNTIVFATLPQPRTKTNKHMNKQCCTTSPSMYESTKAAKIQGFAYPGTAAPKQQTMHPSRQQMRPLPSYRSCCCRWRRCLYCRCFRRHSRSSSSRSSSSYCCCCCCCCTDCCGCWWFAVGCWCFLPFLMCSCFLPLSLLLVVALRCAAAAAASICYVSY